MSMAGVSRLGPKVHWFGICGLEVGHPKLLNLAHHRENWGTSE